jgi:hypothetical protein
MRSAVIAALLFSGIILESEHKHDPSQTQQKALDLLDLATESVNGRRAGTRARKHALKGERHHTSRAADDRARACTHIADTLMFVLRIALVSHDDLRSAPIPTRL